MNNDLSTNKIHARIRQRQDGVWINDSIVSYDSLLDLLKAQDEILEECAEMYGKVKVLKRIRNLERNYNQLYNPFQRLRAYDKDIEDCVWIDILKVQ